MRPKTFFNLLLAVFALLLAGRFIYINYSDRSKVAGISTSAGQMNVRGLIITHHDLAREYIIRTLDIIKRNNDYSYIVIFGPDHFYPDETAYLTSTKVYDYSIPGEKIRSLMGADKNVIEDTVRVEKEHSFNTPAGYLKNYYPDAKFIPIVVPQNFDKRQLQNLAAYLVSHLPGDTLYVASVDFAHEKSVLEAGIKDKESEEAIRNFDFDTIYSFKSDHMDSPASVGLLLNIMEKTGSKKWELLFDSHGAFIENDPSLQGTSYLFGIFSE